jgi:hypothetical protein
MAGYIERTEEIMLAMNAGARAIENTRRYHGAVYIKDLSSENSQEIPYLLAAKVLREVSDAPAANVAPIEALERLRDELCAQDLITLEGLRKLNTLIWKYTTVHDGGLTHGCCRKKSCQNEG